MPETVSIFHAYEENCSLSPYPPPVHHSALPAATGRLYSCKEESHHETTSDLSIDKSGTPRTVMFKHRRINKTGDAPCIYVHAGAGYHSIANERIHLQACNDSAKAGMAVLRAGGCAVDAVEIAVKILEDREITNAGYGSNMAIDGVVECDAVVVDHNGRSGGAGAVAQVKNPISLARLILDLSNQPLSLKRVPPNLLVSQGATEFAAEHGMPILPHDALISPAARERWLGWRADMRQVERRVSGSTDDSTFFEPVPVSVPEARALRNAIKEENARSAHTEAIESSVWNEAQPISPPPSDTPRKNHALSGPASTTSDYHSELPDYEEDENGVYTDPFGPPNHTSMGYPTPSPPRDPATTNDGPVTLPNHPDTEVEMSDVDDFLEDLESFIEMRRARPDWHDGSSGSDRASSTSTLKLPSLTPSPPQSASPTIEQAEQEVDSMPLPKTPDIADIECPSPQHSTPLNHVRQNPPLPAPSRSDDDDVVTDTVGVIAIDRFGNIACGASSGGIGMKHRGRVGPAALNGVGAAVIPADPDDKERKCVAVVTSGTGEHMGTTMTSRLFSERLYTGLKKGKGGKFEEADNDDDLIKHTIEKEFMGHASVTANTTSAAAIGILAVVKSRDGVQLSFAHNTDSFAIASQHADESHPVTTMSRSSSTGSIALGGRAFRTRRRRVA